MKTSPLPQLQTSDQVISMTAGHALGTPHLTSAQQVPAGFILVPVVDNASNMMPLDPAKIDDKDEKKSERKVIQCPVPGCNKTFRKASKLKVHEMLHTGERPYKCTILGCEWAFTTPHKLKRHMEAHEGRKDYVCEHPGCGHKFTTIYNLNTHRKLHTRPCTGMPLQICLSLSIGVLGTGSEV